MKRLKKGALAGKLAASFLACAILCAQTLPVFASDSLVQGQETPVKTLPPLADEQPAAAPAQKTNLQFTPTEAQPELAAPLPVPATTGDASAADKTDTAVAPAAPEVTEAKPVDALATSDNNGEEIAQSTSGSRTPTDPLYTKLPPVRGDVKIRRGFVYFPTNQIIHNLIFRDTPVKEVIAEIAHRGNLNVIIDRSVVGRITGDLHDLTLNEAMDTVLSSAGLQSRQLDNSTIIIGMPNALFRLGLNRPLMRVFKISYASPYEVAQLLWASAFNRGFLTDFTASVRARDVDISREIPLNKTQEDITRLSNTPTAAGGSQISKSLDSHVTTQTGNEEREAGMEATYPTRPDQARGVRGQVREQLSEGTGFNSGATDPGSETIRANMAVVSDFQVEQNGGGPIAIPDSKNRQLIICGTQDDINIAEEVIRLLDRRPRQVHIQSSLVELQNSGIRQLGAAINLQGEGASSTLLGGAGAPMVNFLPGLGSAGLQLLQTFTGGGVTQSTLNNIAGIAPIPVGFSASGGGVSTTATQLGVLNGVPAPLNGFTGILGAALPITSPTIAGVSAVHSAQSAFNFLTLSKRAGGRANIATVPTGVNIDLHLVLQTQKGKLLANPSVIVDDNTEALITLANEVVHKVTTTVSLGVVSTNVELVKAGIFLDVVPKITEDGFIVLRLRPQVSSPLGGPQEFANGSVVVTLLNVREVMAQEVRVKNGQTLVIGGLFSEQEAATLAKVPYLAEAPILGALFRNTVKGRNRTELMLLITPKIVEDEPPTSISEGGGGPTPL